MRYKTVTSYPNYEVSDEGDVRNKKTSRILQPQYLTKGYLGVRLYNNGNGKTLKLHRLVALAFVDGYFEGAQVNHKDGNKANNHYSNLEWCTNQENHLHKMANGLNVTASFYSDRDFADVHKLRSDGLSTRAIAAKTGISKSYVHRIITDFI